MKRHTLQIVEIVAALHSQLKLQQFLGWYYYIQFLGAFANIAESDY
jgi:hypothetical protein